MSKEIVTLKLKNINFINTKNPILISDVNFNKIIVSNKVPFGKKGFKYFIGYKDDRKVRPLCIILSKITAYRRNICCS